MKAKLTNLILFFISSIPLLLILIPSYKPAGFTIQFLVSLSIAVPAISWILRKSEYKLVRIPTALLAFLYGFLSLMYVLSLMIGK